jgi:hypothetical protein
MFKKMSRERLPLKTLLKTVTYLQELSSDLENFPSSSSEIQSSEEIIQKHTRLSELTNNNADEFKETLAPLNTQFCKLVKILIVKYIQNIKNDHLRPTYIRHMLIQIFQNSIINYNDRKSDESTLLFSATLIAPQYTKKDFTIIVNISDDGKVSIKTDKTYYSVSELEEDDIFSTEIFGKIKSEKGIRQMYDDFIKNEEERIKRETLLDNIFLRVEKDLKKREGVWGEKNISFLVTYDYKIKLLIEGVVQKVPLTTLTKEEEKYRGRVQQHFDRYTSETSPPNIEASLKKLHAGSSLYDVSKTFGEYIRHGGKNCIDQANRVLISHSDTPQIYRKDGKEVFSISFNRGDGSHEKEVHEYNEEGMLTRITTVTSDNTGKIQRIEERIYEKYTTKTRESIRMKESAVKEFHKMGKMMHQKVTTYDEREENESEKTLKIVKGKLAVIKIKKAERNFTLEDSQAYPHLQTLIIDNFSYITESVSIKVPEDYNDYHYTYNQNNILYEFNKEKKEWEYQWETGWEKKEKRTIVDSSI